MSWRVIRAQKSNKAGSRECQAGAGRRSIAMLGRVVREVLTEKVTFRQRRKRRESCHVHLQGKVCRLRPRLSTGLVCMGNPEQVHTANQVCTRE